VVYQVGQDPVAVPGHGSSLRFLFNCVRRET
jgi:hypothetical protein